MCVWYKVTNLLLLSVHIVNIFYLFGMMHIYAFIYVSLVINITALITFMIYRVSRGILKILC